MDPLIIVVVLLACYLYWQNDHEVDINPTYQTHLNINVNDLCKDTDKCLEQCKVNEDMVKDYKDKFVKERDARLRAEAPNYDFLYYGNDDFPLKGDDKLAYKMYELGKKNKQAIISRATYDKYSFAPYIEEELRNHENSIWYEDDTLDMEF